MVWGTASLLLVGVLAQGAVLLGLGIDASFGGVAAVAVASGLHPRSHKRCEDPPDAGIAGPQGLFSDRFGVRFGGQQYGPIVDHQRTTGEIRRVILRHHEHVDTVIAESVAKRWFGRDECR